MKENAYFDNAATSWPKPEPVYAFMDAFFRSHGVNPGRSGHTLAVEAERMIVQTRLMLARFFGFAGPSERVVFTQNGTDALNQAIGGLLRAGDHLVTTRLEHNAVLRTTNHLERDGEITITRVAPGGDGCIDAADIEAAIRPRTRAIVLNHASNVTGRVQPLADVARIARDRDLPLIVDAAQTAGVLPIDMDALGIAVLTFPGHKGLFGPMGIGGLIVSEAVTLRPSRFGGTGVDSISTYQPEAYPHRLEAGTVSVPGIAGLHAAQHWFRELGERLAVDGTAPGTASGGLSGAARASARGEGAGLDAPSPARPDLDDIAIAVTKRLREASDSGGPGPSVPDDHGGSCRRAVEHVHAVEMRHLARIEAALAGRAGVRVLGGVRDAAAGGASSDAAGGGVGRGASGGAGVDARPGGERVATLSFTVEGMDTARVADALDADHGICARAGLQCAPLVHVDAGTAGSGGTVRLSPGYFTDEEDMAQLLGALDDVLADPSGAERTG